tara:strand:+ start:497 stop:1060 length:564 start_codon:yes stop_codon:yes gene_type:complete
MSKNLNQKQEKVLLNHINKFSRDINFNDTIVSSSGATFVYSSDGMFKFQNNDFVSSGVERIVRKLNNDGYKSPKSNYWHSSKMINDPTEGLCWCIRSYFPYYHTTKVMIDKKWEDQFKLTFYLDESLLKKDGKNYTFYSIDPFLGDKFHNVYSTHKPRIFNQNHIETYLDADLLKKFKIIYPGQTME